MKRKLGVVTSQPTTARRRLPTWVPQGSTLPDEVWATRHRWVMALLVVQAVGLLPYGLVRNYSLTDSLLQAALPLAMAAWASVSWLSNVTRASVAAVGLMVESGIIVHLSGGVIEAHFHFFVMVPIVALYESWIPFGLAVGYVLFQHGIVGTLDSSSVYNHDSAQSSPWTWAGIHAGLFAFACLGALAHWTLHEHARQVREQLKQAIEQDALTSLPNRTGLKRLGQEAIGRGDPISVLLIDLDGFKDVNDTLGHAGGDLLLAQVATRLRTVLDVRDVLGRLGGDEYVVLLPRCGPEGAQAIADRLRDSLTESFAIHDLRMDINGSVGISSWSPSSPDPENAAAVEIMTELLRQADVAMYVAKQDRSGTARYEPVQDHEARRRLTFISELRRAIDSDELVVYFQPKISLASGSASGLEALVRWQHPERGLIGPGDFIPTAERTSLIDSLTEVVLDKALAAVRQWHDADVLLGVSVNVSPHSLTNRQLVHTVDRLLHRYDLEPRWLCLEITEEVLLVDDDGALFLLREMQQCGVLIAIDDYGSGYASMSYLQRLAADELKIDRSIVGGLGAQEPSPVQQRSAADYGLVIVRSTIEMGHSLGLRVVAEGVESAEAMATLTAAGCDEAQGYLIARPMPADDVLPWLRTRAPIRPAHQRLGAS
ncbi:MAG: putative bifunctional diguanylate cyclase/phosphodiesterase [Nocardioidaceae bacterium]